MPINTLAVKKRFGLPILGKLYLGAKKETRTIKGKETTVAGQAIPYFRAEFKPGLIPPEKLKEVFTRLYGEKPECIEGVTFIFDSIEGNLEMDLEHWATSKKTGEPVCITRCDGTTANTLSDDSYGRVKLPCKRNPDEMHCKLCKPKMRLFFWLPEFSYYAGVIGGFMIESTSITNMGKLQSNFEAALNVVSSIKDSAFALKRVPMPINGKPSYAVEISLTRASAQLALAEITAKLTAGVSIGKVDPQRLLEQPMQNANMQLPSGDYEVLVEALPVVYMRDGIAHFKANLPDQDVWLKCSVEIASALDARISSMEDETKLMLDENGQAPILQLDANDKVVGAYWE